MKKIFKLVIIMFFMIAIKVNALDECKTEELNRVKELAKNVQFKYDYEFDKEAMERDDNKYLYLSYKLDILNYDDDLRIYYKYDFEDESEKILIKKEDIDSLYFGEGDKVNFYIYSYTINLCTNKLLNKKTITFPVYNEYYYFNQEKCNQYPDFKYCQEFLNLDEYEVTYEEIDNLLEEYKANIKIKEEKKGNLVIYIVITTLVVGVIVASVLIIKKRKKQEDI